ncbi:ABC transporter substrate-binding protein [Pseudidiomarina terrestris]|uniref:ABC transporter substrate-binding protein n=1 Tax=Pseudidiomarina terrestris TaxID=2820060 RepID=A0ABT8MFG7_9GAMM|nr:MULTISPECIES: ABC transporter substrate-binding protein [unclassified Pseudidiomarina]MDN7126596.1 ABC transporter substrate-binding protein [Pseudidiomarina sp. 1APR75-33.1]MDN7128662.1 ABC transporter substrate-binding protein [Pseudidiomarina sp. 1APR75-15]MDN7135079.1 ABC transporter substrate-binding protein [Pseudidiomarina sp. 1ASP75-5]MDN7137750.1 ABC transporter substrate-binding protein [Pseudidiomarina sp. 1ASP75-14]
MSIWRLWLLTPIITLAACSPNPDDVPPLRNGIVYCSEGNPESFNPQLGTSGTTIDATSAQLYDRLLDYDDAQQKFRPALAESWQALDQGKRYRFMLRPNVNFHSAPWFTPSRHFNADDVVFSFKRWLEESHPYHEVNGGNYPFFTASGLNRLITDVVAVNATTVDFYLKRSDSSFLANLATDFAIILSAEYGAELLARGEPDLIDKQPIGTGPFVFEEFRKDLIIRYHRHDDYWRDPARIEQLVYSITQNANKRMLKLITGECDVIPYPLVEELAELDTGDEIQISSTVNPNIAFWAFNTDHPPFDNVLVRRALASAVNREAIIQTIYNGNARLATGVLPETSWAYSPVDQTYGYDPERAQALLAAAGFEEGFEFDIWAMPVQRAYNPNAQKMAELIQSDLAQIGVRANIVSYEWNAFRRRLARDEHDSVLIGWIADNADPDNFFRPLLSCAALNVGTNRANWCEPEFDQLLMQAISEPETDSRKKLYQEIENWIYREAPLVPIANSMRFQAHRSDIHGVEVPAYGGVNFRHAYRASSTDTGEQP